MIIEHFHEYWKGQAKAFPSHVNRASSIGDACLRKLVYYRVAWEKAILSPPELIALFKEGNLHENATNLLMIKCNIPGEQQQRAFFDKMTLISGHVDGTWEDPETGQIYPYEVKSMSPNIWNQVNSIEDFQKKHWLKRYIPQLMCYLFFNSLTRGVFLLKNKSTGLYKEIFLDFDYDVFDEIEKKALKINEHVALWESAKTDEERENSLPDRLINLKECEMCEYRLECRPNIDFGAPIKISDDPLSNEKIKRHFANLTLIKEAAALEKEVKSMLKAEAETTGADAFSLLSDDIHVRGKRDARGAWRFSFMGVGEEESDE